MTHMMNHSGVLDTLGRKKILIVEDNVFNLKLFRDILTLNGYDVTGHPRAEGTLELIDEMNPDLILLDIGLPDLSGRDLAKQIKQDSDKSNIPLVAVTAFAMKEDQERFIEDGFDAFLTKPISVKGFVETIKEFTK